jgi:hypothetical protein
MNPAIPISKNLRPVRLAIRVWEKAHRLALQVYKSTKVIEKLTAQVQNLTHALRSYFITSGLKITGMKGREYL